MRSLIHFALWWARLADATTQTTPGEREALARQVRGRLRPVELGVWHGVTTRRLRAAMSPDAELWAVDPYPKGRLGVSFPEQIARREVDAVENGRVRWVRTSGVDAAALWQSEGREPADFVFVDGDHSYEAIAGDWAAWSGLVSQGGVIALHDSRSTPERPIDDAGSARFTRETILTDSRFRCIETVDSLTVVERV